MSFEEEMTYYSATRKYLSRFYLKIAANNAKLMLLRFDRILRARKMATTGLLGFGLLSSFSVNHSRWQPSRSSIGRTAARANLTGLVLGCIEANFCKKICVGKLSPRSTQRTPLHSSVISLLYQNFAQFRKKSSNFSKKCFRAVQRSACVDLGESFQTHIYLGVFA